VRLAAAYLLALVVAVPAAGAKGSFLISGHLKDAPAGTPVMVSVDVLGESGQIPILAAVRTDAQGRFTIDAPYDRRAARAARLNGGAINFSLDAFTKHHEWSWEFSRRYAHGRWQYDRNGAMRGVVIKAWR
jgi:hypothetical protein